MNPWEHERSPWKTKSAFFAWLRGNLRRAWMRYPLSNTFKNEKCNKQGKGRVKWLGKCEICSQELPKSYLQVDHLTPCGALKDFQDLPGFCERMFCHPEEMRLVCRKCHEMVTLMEKTGMGMQDAIRHKMFILFSKKKKEEKMEILKNAGMDVQKKTIKELNEMFKTHLM